MISVLYLKLCPDKLGLISVFSSNDGQDEFKISAFGIRYLRSRYQDICVRQVV